MALALARTPAENPPPSRPLETPPPQPRRPESSPAPPLAPAPAASPQLVPDQTPHTPEFPRPDQQVPAPPRSRNPPLLPPTQRKTRRVSTRSDRPPPARSASTPARARRSRHPQMPAQTPPAAPPEPQTVPTPTDLHRPNIPDIAAPPPASPVPPEETARRSPPGPPSARGPPSLPRRPEVILQPLPAFVILVLPNLRLQRELRRPHRQPCLEHKSQRVGQMHRLQLRLARPLPCFGVRPMPCHAVVQTRAARNKPLRLRVLLAEHQPHELVHHVAVKPRRPEGVLGHDPSRRENRKVHIRGSRYRRGCRQHRVNRRVR